MLVEKVLRFFITVFMGIAGAALMHLASPILALFISTEILKMDMGIFKITLANLICMLLGAIVGGIIGFILSPFFTTRLKRFSVWFEGQLSKTPIHDVVAGAFGLAIGLIIANLLGSAFSQIPVIGGYIPVIFSIVLGYLGIHIMIRKRKELTSPFDGLVKLLEAFEGLCEE